MVGTSMPSNDTVNRYVVAGIVIALLVSFLYSVLIAGRPLGWLGVVILLAIFHLGWRFVRALERIADALEP